MTTASLEIAQRQPTVKAELTAALHDILDRLFHDGLTIGMADTERQVCREVRALGAKMLAEVLGGACLAACPPAAPGVVSRRRRDKDYRAPLLTVTDQRRRIDSAAATGQPAGPGCDRRYAAG